MSAAELSRRLGGFGNPLLAREWLPRVVCLALACLLGAWVGQVLPQAGLQWPLIWPPAGIALAVLLRFGVWLWPGAWLAAFLVALQTGAPMWLAALWATGGTLGPVLGALALRYRGLHIDFDRHRDLWLYGALGVTLATAVSAGSHAVFLAASGRVPSADILRSAAYLWVGDAMGAVVVGIPLLTVSRGALRKAFGRWRWPLSVLLIVAIPAIAALAFGFTPADHSAPSPLLFVPHLLLCWLAARSGLFAASFTALVLAMGSLLAAQRGIGPFVLDGSDVGAAFLVGYISSLLAIPLLISALTGEMATSGRRWRLALDGSHIGIGEWNLARGRVDLSSRWLALLGYQTQSFGHSLASFWSLVHADDLVTVQRAMEPLRSSRIGNAHAECRMRCRDGNWRAFELHAVVAERDRSGRAVSVINTARDISQVHEARERQDLSESLFEHLHEGLLITDAQQRVLEANPTFSQITGYPREALVGTVPSLLRPAAPGSEAELQQTQMRAGLDAHGSWRGQMRDRRRDGEWCLLQVTVSAVRNANGSVRNHVLAIADITRASEQLEQLQRQAHFDELTRLPNRVRLAQMLQAAMQTSRHEGSLLTVCYLDLDHFKPVNDRFGHEAGDRLLVELAERMKRSLRSWASGDDVVARIGGDEFVLLLRTVTLEESRHAVERVLSQVCQPYALGVGAGPVMVTASIGATVFPLDGADAETLLRHADHAMYGAKQAGRNGYLFFDAEHDRRAEARFVALGRVQEALDAHEFRLYFQPKVDMRTSKVLGAEALLRWKHPDHGVISPAQFLPLIENTGLSISVGNWVLKQGIEQLAQWLRLGLDITVSINISARHLQEPLFAQHLSGLLSRHQAAVAHRLVIEVLETAALADIDHTCELMEECRALGVRFALDDFGTGYSTFTYLKRLPIDMLKIDRSFVTNMLSDRQDLAIVEGVIGLSQTFACSVVAEGVETPEQAQRLIEIGCDVGQGNGIAAAMPPEQLVPWVREYKGMALTHELIVL